MNNNLKVVQPVVVIYRNTDPSSHLSSNESSHSLNLVTEVSEVENAAITTKEIDNIREFELDSLIERMNLPNCFKTEAGSDENTVTSGAKLSNSDYAYFDSNANHYRFLFTEEPVRDYSVEYSNPSAAEVVMTNSDYAYLDDNCELKPEYKVLQSTKHSTIATPSDPWMLRPLAGSAHPQIYQKYTAFGLGGMPSLSYAGSDTNTIIVNDRISDDVYNKNYNGLYMDMETPMAPTNQTLNKRALNTDSRAELAELVVDFEEKKMAGDVDLKLNGSRSNETVNKCLIGQDSVYDLEQLPAIASKSAYGLQVIRDWGVQSLEDLRALPDNFETQEEFVHLSGIHV